jgi:two-component system LytT family sensor kinase
MNTAARKRIFGFAIDPTLVPIVLFIIALWIVQFVLLTVQRTLMGETDPWMMLIPRLLTSCVGVVISIGVWKFLGLQAGKSLWHRVLTAVCVPLVACVVHATANFAIFQTFLGQENYERATIVAYASSLLYWYWCYLAISGLLLSLIYSRELAQRERDLAKVEQLAQTAQIRALRYQINPHFMFNTLNSIAALICTEENATAEKMVENLGEFFRASLAVDPQDDHPLEQEVHLQSLYLAIEQLRYPDRVNYKLEIDPRASQALVPSLILQPLTENVFRHAVARSSARVALEIAANVDGELLVIEVSNSAPNGSKADSPGTGVGLNNVRERLRARFGKAQKFLAQRSDDGAFKVRLEIPLSFGAAA